MVKKCEMDAMPDVPAVPEGVYRKMERLCGTGWYVANFDRKTILFSDFLADRFFGGQQDVTFEFFVSRVLPEYVYRIDKGTAELEKGGLYNQAYPIYDGTGYTWVQALAGRPEKNAHGDQVVVGTMRILETGDYERYTDGSYKVQLGELIESQRYVSELLLRLLHNPDIDAIINDILANIVEKFSADRSYIFSFDLAARTHNCAYEVTRHGITSEMDDLQNCPMDQVPWWCGEMLSRRDIILSDISVLEHVHQVEYEVLSSQDIKSLMVVPLDSGNGVWGYIGVDIVDSNRQWTETEKQWFHTISNYISVCLELHKAVDAARRSDTLKSAFLANMSHEIRTPLNAIVGFSSILNETDDPAQRAEFAALIQQNNDQLLQLIADILDLSKIEAGVLDVSYGQIEVNELCSNAVSAVAMKAKPGVEVRFASPGRALPLYSDRHRLTQVLTNFLSNAMKFTDQGSITLDYSLDGERITFRVTDTGIGMTEEQARSVFGRFVKFNNFVQGTGLGLSICQVIAEKLGGEVGVQSEPGKGSCFWIALPYVARAPHHSEEKPAAAAPRKQDDGHPRTILVAEDNEGCVKIITQALGRNYELIFATDGEQALGMFLEHEPDLVLMDIKMPGVDGLDAARAIRAADDRVPIVAVSAYAYQSDREAALAAGCSDFLAKPIIPEALREMVARYV